MSHRELRRRRRRCRHVCADCQERRARYQYKGHVRADRSHVLCFECFRAERERMRARQIASGASAGVPAMRREARQLTAREIEHRRRMLHVCEQALRQSAIASSAARV